MDVKLDAFAHVLPTGLLNRIKKDVPNIIEDNLFLQIPSLSDFEIRHQDVPKNVKQIISNVNLNPEDYFVGDVAADMCWKGNEELSQIVADNSDIFETAVAMVPMNNIPKALKIIDEQAVKDDKFVGIQLFTRALDKSIASSEFEPVFKKMSELNLPIWLHPVFDNEKRENNITFSWEYELTQAMYQIVKAGYFEKYPNLKIIVHHAGAMVPFFTERIRRTMSEQEYLDFKKFYVDTAILGNTKALELALDFYGKDHIVFGTDAPFAVMPNGATTEIMNAIDGMNVSAEIKSDIYRNNILKLIKR